MIGIHSGANISSKINVYLFKDREEKSLLRLVECADAYIIYYRHTNSCFKRCGGSGRIVVRKAPLIGVVLGSTLLERQLEGFIHWSKGRKKD